MSVVADTRPLDAVAAVIEARKQFMGETAEKAVTATCINILVSLRADTSTVGKKPAPFDGRYLVEIEEKTGLNVGWAHPGKNGFKGRRVVRPGGGKALDRWRGHRIINLAGNYKASNSGKAYTLAIYNVDGNGKPFYPSKGEEILCIARCEADVRKFAQNRIMRRIGQYRGISKRALGAAMHAFAANQSGQQLGGDLQRLADAVVDVKLTVSGFEAGNVSASVADNLPHAQQALKSGSMSQSLMKASNKTVGIINRFNEKFSVFTNSIETPFPEVVRGASRNSSARHSSGLYFSARDTLIRLTI